jgi:hypothetical protein
MDRLLSVIQRLVIVAVWLLAAGTIVMGLGLFTVDGYGIHFRLLVPTIVVLVGVLFGFFGTKLVNWIFNKE